MVIARQTGIQSKEFEVRACLYREVGRILRLFVLVASLLAAWSPVAIAQEASGSKTATQADQLVGKRAQSEQEFENIRQQIVLSKAKKDELQAEISALESDRASLNRNLIDTSARSRDIEARADRLANRLEELRKDEEAARQSLLSRRSILIEVIAALQRMGHKPPPAILVSPQDALSSVRSAILLGAVIPEIRSETEVLAADLKTLVELRSSIEENSNALRGNLLRLAEEEQRLSLLLEEKKKRSNLARAELTRQTALAAELAGKAGNLQGLINQLENKIDAVRKANLAAEQATSEAKRKEQQRIAEAREEAPQIGFSDTSRITPAIPFAKARGLLPRPVSGVELASFKQKTNSGDISQGISIATRTGSVVTSPSDGWIIYAGPFRSYGQLLIVNAGDGYHVVLAGMERIDVQLGQFVLAGEPIGAMGSRKIASAVTVDIGSLRPVLYVEFRKDGESIDPSPWWINKNLEERNG